MPCPPHCAARVGLNRPLLVLYIALKVAGLVLEHGFRAAARPQSLNSFVRKRLPDSRSKNYFPKRDRVRAGVTRKRLLGCIEVSGVCNGLFEILVLAAPGTPRQCGFSFFARPSVRQSGGTRLA